MFVNRDSESKKDRDAAVDEVIERQIAIVRDGQDFPPVLVFVEGANSNGEVLLKFRRGAFEGGYPVRPTYTKTTKFGPVNPSYDTLRFFDL